MRSLEIAPVTGCLLPRIVAELSIFADRPDLVDHERQRMLRIAWLIVMYRAQPAVADAAMAAGADIINTVEGVDAPEEMLEVVKRTGAVFVMTYEKSYVNPFAEELAKMAKAAEAYGIERDKIILDPGIGFGKTQEENLRILNELPLLTQTSYPVLLGCSRKSVIGNVLNVPTDERLPGTLVTTVLASLAGVGIVRVHDVSENVRALRMLTAVCSAQTEE